MIIYGLVLNDHIHKEDSYNDIFAFHNACRNTVCMSHCRNSYTAQFVARPEAYLSVSPCPYRHGLTWTEHTIRILA